MNNQRRKTWLPYLLSGLIAALTVIIGLQFTRESPDKLNTSGQGKIVSLTYKKNQPASEVYEKVKDSVVTVYNLQKYRGSVQPVGSGSGVVYKIDGDEAYIITNSHVIEGNQRMQVILLDETVIDAKVVGNDSVKDLAVLKISTNKAKNIKAAKVANSDDVKTGEKVLAVGSPLGVEFSHSVTHGIVSATHRNLSGLAGDLVDSKTTYIQTDTVINHGNSGGPLFNYQGQVIGINTLGLMSPEDGIGRLNFAIESNIVKKAVDKMIEEGK